MFEKRFLKALSKHKNLLKRKAILARLRRNSPDRAPYTSVG
jgi:hypothetical protein